MQKITLFIFLFLLLSCSPTINRPLYKKSEDPKSLILSNMGSLQGSKLLMNKKNGFMITVVYLKVIEQ